MRCIVFQPLDRPSMDEAVEVLRAAIMRANQGRQTGPDVRLALKVLRFVGVPTDAISYFWRSCQTDDEIGRSQSMTAALKRIERILAGKI